MQTIDIIKKYCSMDVEEIFKDCPMKDDVRFIYQNNGCKVLGVAHADTVLSTEKNQPVMKDGVLFTPGLDDRVGIATLFEILPKLGIQLDILITDNEERGASTGDQVRPEIFEKYNWIVEFDRKGEDVVTYDYDSKRFLKALKKSGCNIGQGSFSDLCVLDTDLCRANFGVGYHNEHSMKCHFNYGEYARQINRFVKFYEDNCDTEFKTSYTGYTSSYDYAGDWNNYKSSGKDYGIYDDDYDYQEPTEPKPDMFNKGWMPDAKDDETTFIDDYIQCDSCFEMSDQIKVLRGFNLCDVCQTAFPELQDIGAMDDTIVCDTCDKTTDSWIEFEDVVRCLDCDEIAMLAERTKCKT